MRKCKYTIFSNIKSNKYMDNIRSGLVSAMPVFMLGSFALVFITFIEAMDCKTAFFDVVLSLLRLIYTSTFGIISVIVTVLISIKFLEKREESVSVYIGVIIALVCFVILNGGIDGTATVEYLGVKGMFTAIVSSVGGTGIYCHMAELVKRKNIMLHGGYLEFQDTINSILPIACTILIFAIFNESISYLTGADNFNDVFVKLINALFGNMGRNIFSAMLCIFLICFFWLFGIHGNDVLEPVIQDLFQPAIEVNSVLVSMGEQPTEIFSKTMFDTFIFMGGCGTVMSLFIAIFIFGKSRGNRRVARLAAPTMLFNVSEVMLFGIPIVMNPIFFIPYIVVPLVCLFNSWVAMRTGIVPIPATEVQWTVPVILNGYLATGSVAGSVLQIFNLAVGVLIYCPFVKIYENRQREISSGQIENVIECMKQAEYSGKEALLLTRKDDIGYAARYILFEIEHSMKNGNIDIYYQPQFNEKDECTGVEALMRFKLEMYGQIYPPLVIELAEENGSLTDIEKYVFKRVTGDIEKIYELTGHKIKVSVNVTPRTIMKEEFLEFLKELSESYNHDHGQICIEITEQTYLEINEWVENEFAKLKALGYIFAIDDFSMGSTSVRYLKKNIFDIVKLDGNIVKNIMSDGNDKEIVASIVVLAKSLNMQTIAEYVESREIQKELENVGCLQYQGYYYSPAVQLEELESVINR